LSDHDKQRVRVDNDELEWSTDGTHVLWKERPFTGVGLERWPDGSPFREIEYVNGLKQGCFRQWFPSGRLRREEYMDRDVCHGLSREWLDSGVLVREADYEFGIKLREVVRDSSGATIKEFVLSKEDPAYQTLELFRGGGTNTQA
jgi:hypothetical protein